MTDGRQWNEPAAPPESLHHSSHQSLLRALPAVAGDHHLDAIIVPTYRTPDTLDPVFTLAGELGCEVLVLCSQKADASAAVAKAREHGAVVAAADTGGAPSPITLGSTRVAREVPFDHKQDDISLKRNIGLLVAHVTGWRRVLFLDDDITVDDPDHVRAAAGHLGRDGVTAVGLGISHYPDNSVVCHAHRMTGGDQDTFIGGGALAIDVTRTGGFFPSIYNEDWFFLQDGLAVDAVGHLGEARQSEYNPFEDPRRAYGQEFGDCLAEGLFALLDDDRSVQPADVSPTYWSGVLRRRAAFIESIRARNERPDIEAALLAAQDALRLITPHLCSDFLREWSRDLGAWRDFRDSLEPGLGVIGALTKLGVHEVARTPGFRS
jgi:hypothetical protein